MASKAHYHAGANTPGYMPEGDTFTFTSKRDAARCVADMARQYRDDEMDLPRSRRRTGHGSATTGRIHFERPGDAYDLGISFWWDRCVESECANDD